MESFVGDAGWKSISRGTRHFRQTGDVMKIRFYANTDARRRKCTRSLSWWRGRSGGRPRSRPRRPQESPVGQPAHVLAFGRAYLQCGQKVGPHRLAKLLRRA